MAKTILLYNTKYIQKSDCKDTVTFHVCCVSVTPFSSRYFVNKTNVFLAVSLANGA